MVDNLVAVGGNQSIVAVSACKALFAEQALGLGVGFGNGRSLAAFASRLGHMLQLPRQVNFRKQHRFSQVRVWPTSSAPCAGLPIEVPYVR